MPTHFPDLDARQRARRRSRARRHAARIVYAALDHTVEEFERAKAILTRAGFKDADAVVDTLIKRDPYQP